jgi:L-fuconolactonase
MTRREFLWSSAATAALSTGVAGAVMKDVAAPIPIIDTHTHFYDPTRALGVPWPPRTDKVLFRPRLPADFAAHHGALNVVGTVVVEASEWVEDNRWVLDLAQTNPAIVGFVGHLVPGRPEFADNLSRFAADPIFRGLRLRASSVRALADPAVAADLGRVVERDLSVDMLGGAAILEPMLKLSRLFPGLRIVLNHLPLADWDTAPAAMRPALAELARRPNVFAKVSNVVRRVNGAIVDDPAFYRPALETLLDLFGPDRVVYGSNWPVSDRVAPYATVHRVVADFFAGKDRATAEKFFWRNSHTAYRWLRRGAAAGLEG